MGQRARLPAEVPMPIFWDYPTRISQDLTQRVASQAESTAHRSKHAADELAQRLDRLALVTEALWALLKERSDMTDEELLEHIRLVDLSDGVLDGKVRRGAQACPGCGRTLSKRNARCIYCGVEVVKGPFEGA